MTMLSRWFSISGLLCAAGIALMAWGAAEAGNSVSEILSSRNWATTAGWIVHTGYRIESWQTKTGSGKVLVPIVRYRFVANGKSYESARTWLGVPFKAANMAELKVFLDRYSEGDRVTVRFDPRAPENSTLFMEPDLSGLGQLAVGGFFLILAAVVRWLERIGRKEEG